MASAPFDDPTALPEPVKVVIAGGFGVGKTTLVGTVSEIRPLRTEAVMTLAGMDVDDLELVGDKETTTVGVDYGRLRVGRHAVLLLFGLPGQRRFWHTWGELSRGAVGVVVMVDTRRVEDSFAAIDFFEQHGLPFVIAVNQFQDNPRYPVAAIRDALQIPDHVPVVNCDARDRTSAASVLIELMRHLMSDRYPDAPTARSPLTTEEVHT